MSEQIQKNDSRATIRWKLLTGASALVLTAYVATASIANAEDSTRPQIWIELGGQFSRLQDSQEIFAPPFVALTPPDFTPPQKAERPPLFELGENAALTLQPEGSDWSFSASIRYGRAGSGKYVRHQSYPAPLTVYQINRKGVKAYHTVEPVAGRFTDAAVRQTESHAILDFQAGKDVGLGLFETRGSSSLNAGVRIAQFQSKSRVALQEDPDWRFNTGIVHFNGFIIQRVYQPYHSYAGAFRADRSFHGVGPSLSWKSSLPLAGNPQDSVLTLDWGVNAAVLFGRQKTKTHHQTTGLYHSNISKYRTAPPGDLTTVYHRAPPLQTRSRNMAVPNVGGFAGLSFRYVDAKLSVGYKADFFFGAIDGGIDARKNEDRGFYGPFASISIGLGD